MRQTKAAPPVGSVMAHRDGIKLDHKHRPRQVRSQDTYEIVLATAGKMLMTVGFEQLTTNAICEQAGLTPPALYRYFPNKYAVLKVLGERLMAAQDAVVLTWMAEISPEGTGLEGQIDRIAELQRQIIAATTNFPGGVAINRAVRAVPILQRLHFESRDMIAERLFNALRVRYAGVSENRLRVGTRLIGELSSAVTQMVVEEPERNRAPLIHEAAYLFAIYFQSLSSMAPTNPPSSDRAGSAHAGSGD